MEWEIIQNPLVWSGAASALAATFSAYAAHRSASAARLTADMNQLNRVDAVRAEIVLDRWTVAGHDSMGPTALHVATAYNVGRGPALAFGLALPWWSEMGKLPSRSQRMWDIRAEESVEIDFRVPINRNQLHGQIGHEYYLTRVHLFWTDLHGRKHLLHFDLRAMLDITSPLPRSEYQINAEGIYMVRRFGRPYDDVAEFEKALEGTTAAPPQGYVQRNVRMGRFRG